MERLRKNAATVFHVEHGLIGTGVVEGKEGWKGVARLGFEGRKVYGTPQEAARGAGFEP
jgi:hypothetical protein